MAGNRRYVAGLLLLAATILPAAALGQTPGSADDPSAAESAPDPATALPETDNDSASPDKPKKHGSFAPGVYMEDVTNTIRLTDFHHITISKKDPNVAYVTTWDGYLLKTEDGGQTWDESRLIVERRGFLGDMHQPLYFGAQRDGIGPWGTLHKSNPTFGVVRTGNLDLGRLVRRVGGLRMNIREQLRKDRGPLSRLRVARDPIEIDPMAIVPHGYGGSIPIVGYSPIDPGAGDRAGESGNRNFGVGLPGRAPRLQNVVRRFGKPTAGLNIKQTLLLRGVMPSTINFAVIHPDDPKTVFVTTHFGLFMTEDGGLNWVRTFQGESPRGRMVLHCAVDPTNGNKVYIGTGAGMFVSYDRGRNFSKMTAQGVGEGAINWIQFDPNDPRYIFVGIDYGLLRSSDGGKSWEWIYFTTFPTARIVRYVEIDPHDKNKGYIATHDGLFWTPNIHTAELEDWRRLGGLRFTGYEMTKVSVDPSQKGHMWALSNLMLPQTQHQGLLETGGAYVWESIDGGKNWHIIYSGDTKGRMVWYASDPSDPSLLWLLWTRSMWRMRRRDPSEPVITHLPPDREKQVQAMLRGDTLPTIGNVILAATRYCGFEAQRQLNYRARSRLKALVPRIDISVTGFKAKDLPILQDGLFTSLPYRRQANLNLHFHDFRAMLTWDLAPLAFNIDTMMFGRIDRLNGEARAALERAMHRFYGEYRRLAMRMITNPPTTLRVRLTYKLRMEELRSYIDFMTGGYLTRYRRGDKPQGWDTPWFQRWDGTGPDLDVPHEEEENG